MIVNLQHRRVLCKNINIKYENYYRKMKTKTVTQRHERYLLEKIIAVVGGEYTDCSCCLHFGDVVHVTKLVVWTSMSVGVEIGMLECSPRGGDMVNNVLCTNDVCFHCTKLLYVVLIQLK